MHLYRQCLLTQCMRNKPHIPMHNAPAPHIHAHIQRWQPRPRSHYVFISFISCSVSGHIRNWVVNVRCLYRSEISQTQNYDVPIKQSIETFNLINARSRMFAIAELWNAMCVCGISLLSWVANKTYEQSGKRLTFIFHSKLLLISVRMEIR